MFGFYLIWDTAIRVSPASPADIGCLGCSAVASAVKPRVQKNPKREYQKWNITTYQSFLEMNLDYLFSHQAVFTCLIFWMVTILPRFPSECFSPSWHLRPFSSCIPAASQELCSELLQTAASGPPLSQAGWLQSDSVMWSPADAYEHPERTECNSSLLVSAPVPASWFFPGESSVHLQRLRAVVIKKNSQAK